jgi:hypothetical protein
VRRLREQAPATRAAFLAWGEQQMQPMEEAHLMSVGRVIEALERLIRPERPDLSPGYFDVARAGWLRIGVGSAAVRKVLIRVQGPTTDPDDDVLLEAKEVANLDGLACLESSTAREAVRVVDGTKQLGRLRHDILAVQPSPPLGGAVGDAEPWLDWWVFSWEPSYQEVRVSDLRSVEDLADVVYDSGVQLGANKLPPTREQALSLVIALEGRLRKETSSIVEELLAGWKELAARQ